MEQRHVHEQDRTSWWTRIGAACLALGAVSGAIAAAAPGAGATAWPEIVEGFTGNPTCGDLAPEWADGQTWSEVKVDPPVDGTYGPVTVDMTGNALDFTSTVGVDAVFVKAGNDKHRLYRYDPSGPEAFSGTGLTAAAGRGNGISHISFCFDDDATTTTVAPTTTVVEPTTTVSPTTTVLEPTTTVAPTTVAPTTTVVEPTTTVAPTTTVVEPTTTVAPTTTVQEPTTTVAPTTTVPEPTTTTAPDPTVLPPTTQPAPPTTGVVGPPPEPTTTTAAPPTTASATTVAADPAPTTTAPDTEVLGIVVTGDDPQPTGATTLPVTGGSTGALATTGLVLVGLGLVLVARGRVEG